MARLHLLWHCGPFGASCKSRRIDRNLRVAPEDAAAALLPNWQCQSPARAFPTSYFPVQNLQIWLAFRDPL